MKYGGGRREDFVEQIGWKTQNRLVRSLGIECFRDQTEFGPDVKCAPDLSKIKVFKESKNLSGVGLYKAKLCCRYRIKFRGWRGNKLFQSSSGELGD